MNVKILMSLSLLLLALITLQSFSIPTILESEASDDCYYEKVLDVPYKTQPTDVTCQSTCLKMYSMYMQQYAYGSYGFQNSRSIDEIYQEINTGNERPVNAKNAWSNFTWWLNKEANMSMFSIKRTKDDIEAAAHIVNSIENGFPVILSTNHMRTKGHIIMIVGYTDNLSYPSDAENSLKFICHDPYGAFHPSLLSQCYGNKRYNIGACMIDGSEEGAGRGVLLNLSNLKRTRSDTHNTDQFVMITAS